MHNTDIRPCVVVDPTTVFGIPAAIRAGAGDVVYCNALVRPGVVATDVLIIAQSYSGTYAVNDVVFVLFRDNATPIILAGAGGGGNGDTFTGILFGTGWLEP